MAPLQRIGRDEERPSPLPTGTVTFLFSDIEGSTQRWEAHREAMKAAVAQHERVMRSALEQHNAYVFKTVGDAFCAAFRTAGDAVGAAVDAQRSLAAQDFNFIGGLRVRIGIHTGHADERDGDYFGPAVNRVARLMSIGHGGQTLLSGATRALLANDLPAGTSTADLGSHRLKDLTNPEQVWQLNIAGGISDFPPLKSLDALPNNLPLQHTSFRGRERDLQQVKQLLREHHLITLFGTGGIGKTRLALQAAADVLDDFSDGVWLADLGAIADPELIAGVVAKELGVSQSEEHAVEDAVVQWLKRKQLLLILDNCEHLLETVTRLTDSILRTCSQVSILTTSRQALGVSGEFVYRLPPLEMPAHIPGLAAEAALRYGAIALFVDRATASDMRFKLTDDNLPGVTDICRRLDGIPLAIELAAARVKVLSIPNLAQRLNERFKILTAGSRTALPRQKTLSALIDWSYDLLSPEERTLFNRLAIFTGGFSFAGAAAVCTGQGIEEFEMLDLLASLSDKSLVVAETSGQQERYRLLESTRAYAHDKLLASGEYTQIARRHAEYFCNFAREVDANFGILPTLSLVSGLEDEADNFRAVLEWSLKQGNDIKLGVSLVGALHPLWTDGGLAAEGRRWIYAALEKVSEPESPLVAGRLWLALAELSAGQRRYDAAERSVRLCEAAGDRTRLAWALYRLGSGCLQTGRPQQGAQVSARAIGLLRELDMQALLATVLGQAALFAWQLGDKPLARKQFQEAIASSRLLDDKTMVARIRGNSAEFEFAEGNVEQALINVLEALNIYARGKNEDFLTTYANNSCAYRLALGDTAGAYRAVLDGLHWAREAQSSFDISVSCQHLALIGAKHGDFKDPARLLGYVNAKYKELGLQREFTEQWSFEQLSGLLSGNLPSSEIAGLTEEGAKLTEEQAVETALAIGKGAFSEAAT